MFYHFSQGSNLIGRTNALFTFAIRVHREDGLSDENQITSKLKLTQATALTPVM